MMKRYAAETISEHADGCLVLYADAETRIAKLETEIAQLKADNKTLRKRADSVNIAFARSCSKMLCEANDRAKAAEAALKAKPCSP